MPHVWIRCLSFERTSGQAVKRRTSLRRAITGTTARSVRFHQAHHSAHFARVLLKAVDTHSYWPYAGLMELHVPPELEAKLTRMAAETGRTADQVALDLLASSVGHDEWFRAEVEKGRDAAREGRLIEHEDVAARMDRRYRG